MRLSDKKIREVIFEYIESNNDKVRVLSELKIGKSIADFLVITDGNISGYEIKSDLDTYTRLKSQVPDYNKHCDYCHIVVGQSHQKGVEKHIPEFWGIIVVSQYAKNIPKVEVIREATQNTKASLDKKLSLLWKRELENISKKNGPYRYTTKSKAFIKKHLKETVDKDKLLIDITDELFERDYTI